MKKIISSLFVLIFSSLSFAQDKVCGEWKTYDNGKSFSCLYWTTPYKAPAPLYQETCKTVTDSYGNPQTHCQKLYKHGVCSAWDVRTYKNGTGTAECISFRQPAAHGQRTQCLAYVQKDNSTALLSKKQISASLVECKNYQNTTTQPFCIQWKQEKASFQCTQHAAQFLNRSIAKWAVTSSDNSNIYTAVKEYYFINACQKYKISKPNKNGTRTIKCVAYYDKYVN